MDIAVTDPRARRRVGAARVAAWAVGILLVVLLLAYATLSAYLATQATLGKRQPLAGTPADRGLAYEPVAFESEVDHVPLKGWLLPAPSDRAIILVHGLDKNRWARDTVGPDIAQLYVDGGYNVLVFDLRAQGESGGDRVGLGWYERRDIQGAVKMLEARGFRPGRIGVHGSSYGAATALLAAAATPDIGGVVADSAFADARERLNEEIKRRTGLPPVFTPGIAFFGSAFYGLNFDEITPLRAVPQIAPRPILFIHGMADTRIPYQDSVRLKAADPEPTDELWLVPGAGHTDAFRAQPNTFRAKVLALFDRALR